MARHVLRRAASRRWLAAVSVGCMMGGSMGCQLASGLSDYDVVPGQASATSSQSTSAAVTTSGPSSASSSATGSGGGGGQGGGGGAGGSDDCGNGMVDTGEECDEASTACRDCLVVCDQGVKDPVTLSCYVPRSSAVALAQADAAALCAALDPAFSPIGIGSPEELTFVQSTSLLLDPAWTGGMDPELDGTFVDADGEPFDCPWAMDEPTGEGCVFVGNDGCHDVACDGGAEVLRLVLCERPPPPPP